MAKKKASSTGKGASKGKVQKATLSTWLKGVRSVAQAEAASPRGACLLPNPGGGPRMCVSTDRATCKLLKGTFTAGPC